MNELDETQVPVPLQSFLSRILDAAADGITAQDKTGKLIYANTTAARLIGYPTPKALLEAPIQEVMQQFDVFDEDGAAFSLSNLPGRLALQGLESHAIVLRFRVKASGEERWSSVQASPVYDENREISFVVNTFRDVTEIKLAELAIKAGESERKELENKQMFLAEASAMLVASLDYETTLKNIASLMTPTIADWSSVDILEENGELLRVAVSHVDPEKVRWAYELQKLYPVNMEAETGLAKVIRTGATDYYPDIPDSMLEAAARSAEHYQVMREVGFRSAIVVALKTSKRIYGALTLVTTNDSGRLLSQFDLLAAEELGRMAGLAVENALSYRATQLERERLRVTLTSIGDAVIATEVDGSVNFLNGVAEKLTGWSAEEAMGRQLSEIFPIVNEYSREAVENPVQKVLETGLIVGLANHTLLIRRDGSEIPIEDSAAPIRYMNQDISGVVLVFRDATEERQATSALEAERSKAEYAVERLSRLQALTSVLSGAATMQQIAYICIRESLHSLGATTGAVALFTKDYSALEMIEVTAKSPATHSISRLALDSTLPLVDSAKTGRSFWLGSAESIQKIDPDFFMDKSKIQKSQSVVRLPLVIEERIIGSIGFNFSHPQVFDEDEQSFILGIAHQCSQALERARLYEAEMEAREEAEKANQLKMQFLAMISQELRSPLAAIREVSGGLRLKTVNAEEDEPKQFLDALDKETDKLANLAEQLLDLSRLQSGTLPIEPVYQAVEELMAVANPALEKLTENRHLVTYIPKNLPPVWADTNRIVQVLVNLVSNAVKFSPVDTYITIVASQIGDRIQIDVSDEGIGIPRHERGSVFEAFRQTGQKFSSETQGAGLGLAISKAIIEAHNGSIWIQDKVVGTTISFNMPYSPEENQS